MTTVDVRDPTAPGPPRGPGPDAAAEVGRARLRLADALWGDVPPPTWNKVVQGCVVRLRKVLGTQAWAWLRRDDD
mgnify:CR=1 FL=1